MNTQSSCKCASTSASKVSSSGCCGGGKAPAVSNSCCGGGSKAPPATSCCSGGGGMADEAPLDVSSAEAVHASVQNYYGKQLKSTGDLKYSACITAGPMHPIVKAAMRNVPQEVMDRFYGCGNPLPLGLHDLTVLDLGSGSGRDCYICAQLVGEKGHVIGVDMTDEQLDVARRNIAPFTAKMGYAKPNVEFVKGFIEQLTAAGVRPNSVDVCVSNCVVNLAPDKRAVLQSVAEVLRLGGEMYFSDVYADRRVSDAVRRHPTLVGECIGGALYANDFERLAREVGFADPRIIGIRPLPVPSHLAEMLGETRFFSITYRLFKVPDLEPTRENYHQTATYKGTIQGFPDSYPLDLDRTFFAHQARPVCGNTAAILTHSWLAKHFEVTGDRSVHYGAMLPAPAAIVPSVAKLMADTASAPASGGGGGCCSSNASATVDAAAGCGCGGGGATKAGSGSCCGGGDC